MEVTLGSVHRASCVTLDRFYPLSFLFTLFCKLIALEKMWPLQCSESQGGEPATTSEIALQSQTQLVTAATELWIR